SPSLALMSRQRVAAGFESGGRLAQVNSRIRILGAVYWSQSRHIIAATGSGTVLGIPSYQTRLFTKLAGGCILVTTDQNDEGDPSRTFRFKRLFNVEMTRLLSAHLNRLTRHANE